MNYLINRYFVLCFAIHKNIDRNYFFKGLLKYSYLDILETLQNNLCIINIAKSYHCPYIPF